MSEQTDFDAAYAEVYRKSQADLVPRLEDFEIIEILKRNKQAQYWVAGAHLVPSRTLILPTVRTGRAYVVEIGGIAGATEPFSRTSFPSTLSDGEVTLRDVGYYVENIYNVRGAIQDAWGLKMSKASEFINSSDGDERAIFENCKKMVDAYATPIVF